MEKTRIARFPVAPDDDVVAGEHRRAGRRQSFYATVGSDPLRRASGHDLAVIQFLPSDPLIFWVIFPHSSVSPRASSAASCIRFDMDS